MGHEILTHQFHGSEITSDLHSPSGRDRRGSGDLTLSAGLGTNVGWGYNLGKITKRVQRLAPTALRWHP